MTLVCQTLVPTHHALYKTSGISIILLVVLQEYAFSYFANLILFNYD